MRFFYLPGYARAIQAGRGSLHELPTPRPIKPAVLRSERRIIWRCRSTTEEKYIHNGKKVKMLFNIFLIPPSCHLATHRKYWIILIPYIMLPSVLLLCWLLPAAVAINYPPIEGKKRISDDNPNFFKKCSSRCYPLPD